LTDDVPPATPAVENPRWRWVRRLGPWVITAAVLTAILVKYPVGRIVWGMVPVALVASIGLWFTATTGDYVILRPMAPGLRYPYLLRSKAGMSVLNALGLALNYGGFALWIHRVLGVGWRASGGSVLMITLSDLTAVSAVALVSLTIGGDALPGDTQERLRWAAPILFVVAGLFLIVPRPTGRKRAVLAPWQLVPRLNRPLSVLCRAGTIVILIFATWGGARAFGLPVPLRAWATFLPVLLVIGALPINVGGLGPVQAAWLMLFAPWASGPQILAFQFLWHLVLISALFLRGAPFLRGVIADVARGQGNPGAQAAVATGGQPTVTPPSTT
jgi:hypothetical protein